MYRCEAASVEGFVQQLAVAYISNGYWFYVTGNVPAHKDPRAVDRKLIEHYNIDVSKWTRCRRKKQGLGCLQYLRWDHFFVLIATPGEHPFFEGEKQIHDVRRDPILFGGYLIGCSTGRDELWHASVRIEPNGFLALRRRLLNLAKSGTHEQLSRALKQIPYEPYAPVRRQFATLHRAVNRALLIGGREPIHARTLRWHRTRRKSLAGPSRTEGA